ncbi:MAG: FkbM family methyltransferase [Phycisphaerales bacterium]
MAGSWMFMNPVLQPVALAFGRLELPGWRRVLNRVAGWDHMTNAPQRRVKGKLHGLYMDLDLSDWSDRWAYFLGRYYEAHTQRLFQLALREGDLFVDIGANIGMTTLCAAACVGDGGRVVSFEPNPRVYERLTGHIASNALAARVETRNLGLSDQPGELELFVPTHTGQASFAGADSADAVRHRVPVRVGDAELTALPDRPTFIKIDVEGFEMHVLKGLSKTLESRRPAVVTECVERLFRRAGTSTAEIFAFMARHGYLAHSVEYHEPPIGWPGALSLRRLRGPGDMPADDVLFLHPESEHFDRLAACIEVLAEAA